MAEAAPLPDSAGSPDDAEGGSISDKASSKTNVSTTGSDPKLPDSSSSEGDLVGVRKLQKNDSGIDVEKSSSASTKDGLSSDADCGDSVSECFVDSTGFSESVKSEDSHSRPDDDGDVDASFSDNNLDSSDASPNQSNQRGGFRDTINMETTDGVSSSDAHVNDTDEGMRHGSDEDDEDEAADAVSSKRKRRHEPALSSSDTDSDEDGDTAAMDTGEKSDKEEEGREKSDKPWPKHKWIALSDLRQREIGMTNRTPPSLFRERVQGSLQMVQRLKLQYKMEYHDGCVNALHFNRIGKNLLCCSADTCLMNLLFCLNCQHFRDSSIFRPVSTFYTSLSLLNL